MDHYKRLNSKGDTRGWWLKLVATPEQKLSIARSGGVKISSDRLHMSEIGRKGGRSHTIAHMRKIGRLGGSAKRKPHAEVLS